MDQEYEDVKLAAFLDEMQHITKQAAWFQNVGQTLKGLWGSAKAGLKGETGMVPQLKRVTQEGATGPGKVVMEGVTAGAPAAAGASKGLPGAWRGVKEYWGHMASPEGATALGQTAATLAGGAGALYAGKRILFPGQSQ